MVTLAKVNPDDDGDEIKRRSELARFVLRLGSLAHPKLTRCSSLEDVGKRSMAILEKGKVARVLDKARDSGEVVRLVEKLRQAILIYQVSSGRCQSGKSLTRETAVTTAVHIQSGRAFDSKFLSTVFDLQAQCILGQFKAQFGARLKLDQV